MPKIYGSSEILGDLLVTGSFSILGSASTINTTNLTISDTVITLAYNQSGSPILDQGIMFVRGTGLTQAFIWDESDDTFALIGTNDDHTVIGDININSYSNLIVGGLTTSTIKITQGSSDGYILISDSFGNASWTSSIPGGGVTGSGTALYVPIWETSTRLTNSTIQYDSSNRIGINSAPVSNSALRISSTYSINQQLSVSGAHSNSYLSLSTNVATGNAYGHVTTIGQGLNSNLAFLANLGSGWVGQSVSAGFAYLEGGFVNKQSNVYALYGLMNGTSAVKFGFDLQLSGNNLSTTNYGGRLLVSGASSSNNGLNIMVSGTNSVINYGLDISTTANTTSQAIAIRTSSGNILFNSSYGQYDFMVRGGTSSNHLIAGLASTNNVGIGTSTPNGVAKLDVSSTTQGFLPPRMTTAQRDAIAAIAGLVIYNTTTNKLQCHNGTTWNDLF